MEPPPALAAPVEAPPPEAVAEPPPEAVTEPPPEKPAPPAEPAIDPAIAALSDLVSKPRDAAPVPGVSATLPVPERSGRDRQADSIPSRYYTVQVGSFQDPANAASLARELSGKGWDAFVSDWTNGAGKAWKVVRVGRYGTEKEAADASDELRSAANLRGNVIRVR
ncbi:SPOR domain-containing protein [Skermanella mucosa]|nr:SPOR domain-containing protein [Skermanella mucosa]